MRDPLCSIFRRRIGLARQDAGDFGVAIEGGVAARRALEAPGCWPACRGAGARRRRLRAALRTFRRSGRQSRALRRVRHWPAPALLTGWPATYSRAPRMSWPFGIGTRQVDAARRSPSRQNASVRGLARGETKGSISWVNASSPVLAVRCGGRSRVRSGSTMATFASIIALRRLALTPCSGEPRTALRVTSEPVPAVVGTAMKGRG